MLDRTAALAREFAGDPLIGLPYGIHAPCTCPPEMITDVARRGRFDGLGVHIRLSETAREVDHLLRAHGVTPINTLDLSRRSRPAH